MNDHTAVYSILSSEAINKAVMDDHTPVYSLLCSEVIN